MNVLEDSRAKISVVIHVIRQITTYPRTNCLTDFNYFSNKQPKTFFYHVYLQISGLAFLFQLLDLYSQKTSQSNHTRTTAFSNSMKLSHACGATQDRGSWWRGLTECGPLEKGMANHFSIPALRTP